MGIILRYLFRSIGEKKFRTFIIILSVALSTALLFASMALSDTLMQMNLGQIRSQYGEADLIITAKKNKNDQHLTIRQGLRTLDAEGAIDYAAGIYSAYGTIKNPDKMNAKYNLQLDGVDGKALKRMYDITPILGSTAEITGNGVMIGQRDAERLRLEFGDNFTAKLNDRSVKLRIAAIAPSVGPFKPSSNNTIRIMASCTFLQKNNGAEGKYTGILVGLENNVLGTKEAIKALRSIYKQQDVKEIISEEELRQALSGVTTSLYLMLSLVVIMGVFIIYTSFKVIAFERLPVIGTMRSVGATKGRTDMILFLESGLYGFIGGCSGLAIGFGFLGLFAISLSENPYGGPPLDVSLVYSAYQMIGSIAFAFFMSLLGSAIPIVSVSRLPVKAIILNQMDKPIERTTRPIVFYGMIATALLLSRFTEGTYAIVVDIASLALICVGIIKGIPWHLDRLIQIMAKPYERLLGNVGALAVKNVNGNKSVMNNIALLSLAIAGIIMINTLTASVGKEILDEFKKANFDIMFYYTKVNRSYESKIRSTSGVASVYGFYDETGVSLIGKDYTVANLLGVEPAYFDYWQTPIEGDEKAILENFEKKRMILVSTAIRKKLKLKAGDELRLKVTGGERTYTIAGFIRSTDNNGSIAMIPSKFHKLDFDKTYKAFLYIRSKGDPEAAKVAIEKKCGKDNVWVETIDKLTEDVMKSNSQMMMILQVFSLMTVVIGLFGLINNILMSILSRKRQFAVMRSIGLSKRQLVGLMVAESLFTGMVGGLMGCMAGMGFCYVTGYVLLNMGLDMKLHHILVLYLICLVGAMAITVMSSIRPATRSSRASIIESIKFE